MTTSRKKKSTPVVRKKRRYPAAVMAYLRQEAEREDYRREQMDELESAAKYHLKGL